MSIKLIRPTIEQKDAAIDFKQEFFSNGETVINGSERLDRLDSYEDWLSKVTANADTQTVDQNWVLTDTFFALDEAGQLVGIIDLRHELKGFLTDFGHTGYSIRPSERGKGYATELLKQLCSVAEQAGLSSLQLSVERTNEPSVKTILKNGGVYERSFEADGEKADVYRICL